MTAQIHEKIRYQGKRMRLASCPHFPEDHPRISEVSEEEIEKLALDDRTEIIFSTACWREYIGSWSIRRGKLYLTKLEGRYRLDGKEAIFADWFTGDLRIPKGRMLEYVHAGFNSIYEQELLLTLERGVVIKTEVISPSKFSISID
ncbi:MAG: hypothetical protein HOD11_13255 [Candidatus Marinimicrobia bacterium]|nr:hypothetical protein [Candidatus Neomarinimicrobiota bacterium]MBT4419731.1 hypothetical protein [Candidatus Neomarinimicrobiota bacterium]